MGNYVNLIMIKTGLSSYSRFYLQHTKYTKRCFTGVHNSFNSLLTQILKPFWEVHHPTESQISKETRVNKTFSAIVVKSRMQGSSDQRSLDVLCSTKITEWSSLGVLWSTDSVPSTLISRTMRRLAPPRTREKHHSTPPHSASVNLYHSSGGDI